MALKEALQHIFNNDYQGTEAFINEVIIPVFGNDIHRINLDYAQDDEYHEKAEKAGIQNLIHVAQISDERYNSNDISFFDVTLKDDVNVERARVNIQQLIRSIVARFSHILIVFHYEDVANRPWRFSYAYKQSTITSTTSAKRYTYVFGRDFRGRTAAERFEELKDSQHTDEDFEKAFSVQALSDEFFDYYRAYYAVFVEYITGEKYSDESKLTNIIRKWDWKTSDRSNQFETTFERDAKATRDYIKKMFGRIVFLYFLQRKGWLYNDEGQSDSLYMHHLFEKANRMGLADSFLDDVLEILFFYILNTEKHEDRIKFAEIEREKDVTIVPGWDKIPFLNGGLFQDDEIDRKPCVFPATYFKELFNFLDSYNFTIDENDPEDAEIGIDPEMLGRIFENLLEDNKDKGAYYTPKPIVDYMCRESIIAYLQNEKFSEEGNLKIRTFVETFNRDGLSDKQREYLRDKLKIVKICDPAIGSGAFPMGLVNLLAKLYISLGVNSNELSNIKRHIMQNNIYGVDIESGAVDIARLRFWLAMVVNESVAIPLPNLHFKIMQGNSLLEFYNGEDLSDLTKLKEQRLEGESRGLFDADEAERVNLISLLSDFYSESNHNKSARLFNDIINNVRRQLLEKNIILPEGLDPSANSEFFMWHTWFKEVFDKGGFDIIIGNPPYLKERDNKKVFEPVNNSPFGKLYHAGKMDYWFYFMHKAIEICKPKGIICFITSRYWINSTGAKKLISQIKREASIINIVDIGSLKVFDNVVGHHMITEIINQVHNELCNYFAIEDNVENIELKKFAIQKQILQSNLITKNFEICVSEQLINKTNQSLSDYCDISQGVVEASDRISNRMYKKNPISGFNIGDGIFVLSPLEIEKLNLNDEEKEVLVPYLVDGSLHPYVVSSTEYKLIYSDKDTRDKINSNPLFSNLKNHLDKFQPYITSSNKPYGLHRPRTKSSFTQPKIIGPSMFKTPSFALDENNIFAGMSYNILVPKKQNDTHWILGILNSKFAQEWFNNNAKHRGIGNDVGVDKLRSFPLPVMNQILLEYLSHLVREVINNYDCLKSYKPKIDHVVYHLYDLTYDEVLIIDPETPITREEYENFKIN